MLQKYFFLTIAFIISINFIDKQQETLFYQIEPERGNIQSENEIQTIADLFSLIESKKQSLKIETYSLSQTSLEQVFLSFAKEQHSEDQLDEQFLQTTETPTPAIDTKAKQPKEEKDDSSIKSMKVENLNENAEAFKLKRISTKNPIDPEIVSNNSAKRLSEAIMPKKELEPSEFEKYETDEEISPSWC